MENNGINLKKRSLTTAVAFAIVASLFSIIYSIIELVFWLGSTHYLSGTTQVIVAGIFGLIMLAVAVALFALLIWFSVKRKTLTKYPKGILVTSIVLLFLVAAWLGVATADSGVNLFFLVFIVPLCFALAAAIIFIADVVKYNIATKEERQKAKQAAQKAKQEAFQREQDEKLQSTKRRPFLLAATIIDIVYASIGALVMLTYFIVYVVKKDSMVMLYEEYIASLVVFGFCFVLFLVTLLLSVLLLKRHKNPVSQYPMKLVITNLILCCSNIISLAFFIVSLVKHSKDKTAIMRGETWVETDKETIAHYKQNPNSSQQNAASQGAVSKEDELLKRIKELQKMKDEGIITEAEFKSMKAKLIEKM